MPTLEEKAASRGLGETPKSKMAQAEMAGPPRQTMAEEMAKGNTQLAADLEQQQLSAAEKMGLERRQQVERRIIEGKAPEGTSERRNVENRRRRVDEIQRLKGELAADEVRASNPAGRDTLVRNRPVIQKRIDTLRGSIGESAVTSTTGRLAGIATVGSRVLGAAGTGLNIVEHWRASNAVNTEENKDAPWMDRFGAYVERVTGFEPGQSGRNPLPSEVRAARQL